METQEGGVGVKEGALVQGCTSASVQRRGGTGVQGTWDMEGRAPPGEGARRRFPARTFHLVTYTQPAARQSSWKLCVGCLYAVGPMSRCVSFITMVEHHHQCDCEYSTGNNTALFYFGMTIRHLPGHAIRDGSHQ